MTQTPKSPQTTPPEPLDEAERAIARVLRNLPAGSPPPELDARILGAARRAVHAAPARKRSGRHWLIGFGTAASALLAIGLAMKTHGPAQDAVFVPPADNAAQSDTNTAANEKAKAIPAAASDAAAARDEVQSRSAEPPPIVASPPPPAMPVRSHAPQQDEAPRAADKPFSDQTATRVINVPRSFPAPVFTSTATPMSISPPPPAPPPAPLQSEPMTQPTPPAAIAAPQSSPALGELKKEQPLPSPSRSQAQSVTSPILAGGMAGNAAAKTPSEEYDDANDKLAKQSADQQVKAKSLDRVEISGSKVRRADAERPTKSADATLNPMEWIERIRERIRQGDRAGAATSLRAFVVAHPKAVVPADLQPLLQ